MTRFKLQLAELPKKGTIVGLDFDIYGEKTSNPVIDPLPPMNYGELFAYMFRRFGYPVYGWDGYKDLVRYILTTPRDDMWMNVRPYPDANDLTFSFLAPQEVSTG